MGHPIYKDLLEQWREKATEIAGTSEGFTFYRQELNEFLLWAFAQFQVFSASEKTETELPQWINSKEQLPTKADADALGFIDVIRKTQNGWETGTAFYDEAEDFDGWMARAEVMV
ncbi:hypothetical protein MO867_16745 [Microbulbifer sp. OS29]|uniref:Uncharacterized protein n=1 Tax=Microbulbifer okhotskensis TaxID=2926617 RepID=A0A9X2EQL4_9GAMM|nr:hypothetical protein [Microbulbifer okhotskensis]MCO1335980.1 hypothetical protein [Microbulbifer okhotskensis]